MAFTLDPIEPPKKPRKDKIFGVLDFETQNWIEFVSVGVFDHRKFEFFDYDDTLEALFEWIFDEQLEQEDQTLVYFAHFAGKFDFLFLLDYCLRSSKYVFGGGIPRGSMILNFKVSYQDMTINFWDSSALLPFALRTLTNNFKVASLKGDIDYNFIRHSYDNEDYTYLLFELIEKEIVLEEGEYETVYELNKATGEWEDVEKQTKAPVIQKTFTEKFIVFYDGELVESIDFDYDISKVTYHIKEDFDLWELRGKKEKDKPTLHRIYNRTDHLAYLKNDCEGLHQVLTKFYAWPLIKKAGPAFTIASQAMKVFRTFLKERIHSLDDDVDEFCRNAYVGGRTEIFKMFYDHPQLPEEHIAYNAFGEDFSSVPFTYLYCHDANSLYPESMHSYEYPTTFTGWTDKYEKGVFGVYHCKVRVPKMHIPPLPVIHDGKLIFPVGVFTGYWTNIELDMAMSVGVEIIEVFRGALFATGGKIFSEYIDNLYQIRVESGGDSVDGIIAKTLMNASYGKFAQSSDKENIDWETGEGDEEDFYEVTLDNGKTFMLVKKKIELKSFKHVVIGLFVTSRSRTIMYPYYLKCGKRLFYTDTDSIYSTLDFGSSKRLGELKEEERTFQACFLLPKLYITDAKLKMKGFEKKTLTFNMSDFMTAMQGELGVLKSKIKSRPMTFKQAISRTGKVLAINPESSKEIRSTYNKRIVHKNGELVNWTTEAIELNE